MDNNDANGDGKEMMRFVVVITIMMIMLLSLTICTEDFEFS